MPLSEIAQNISNSIFWFHQLLSIIICAHDFRILGRPAFNYIFSSDFWRSFRLRLVSFLNAFFSFRVRNFVEPKYKSSKNNCTATPWSKVEYATISFSKEFGLNSFNFEKYSLGFLFIKDFVNSVVLSSVREFTRGRTRRSVARAFEYRWKIMLKKTGPAERSHRWFKLHLHTLRKFFRTNCVGVDSSYREFWMGHKGGYLDESYFRADEKRRQNATRVVFLIWFSSFGQ